MKKPMLLLFMLILFSFMFMSVSNAADVGPKPSLKVVVKNPPDTEYYLDLLVDYTGDKLYKNIRDSQGYSEEIFNRLKNYQDDGWRPALLTGTRVPLSGKLTGEKEGNNMVHTFTYIGVPERFKVIIATADNEIIVSKNPVNRKAFTSTVYFDCNTGRLWEKSAVLSYIYQFLCTCSLTLIIEGFILMLFGFSIKNNWKAFLAINIFTQIMLTGVIYSVTYIYGSFAALFLYIPFEIAVLIIEAILFAKYLKEHSKVRRTAFAVTANVLSFFIGFATMIIYPMM